MQANCQRLTIHVKVDVWLDEPCDEESDASTPLIMSHMVEHDLDPEELEQEEDVFGKHLFKSHLPLSRDRGRAQPCGTLSEVLR
jgi:hypothetical protein